MWFKYEEKNSDRIRKIARGIAIMPLVLITTYLMCTRYELCWSYSISFLMVTNWAVQLTSIVSSVFRTMSTLLYQISR